MCKERMNDELINLKILLYFDLKSYHKYSFKNHTKRVSIYFFSSVSKIVSSRLIFCSRRDKMHENTKQLSVHCVVAS